MQGIFNLSYFFAIFLAIFSAIGTPMLARGIETTMLTRADFTNVKRKLSVNPTFMIVITSEIGTDINIAARQDITMP